MKRFFIFLLLLLFASCVACTVSDVPDSPPVPDTPTPSDGYKDPSHQTGTYKVEFVLREKTVTHFYEAGEMPEPPMPGDVAAGIYVFKFKGWDSEIVCVSADATYTAQYDRDDLEYTATFKLAGGRQIKVKATHGSTATAPTVADYQGMKFVCWDVEPYTTNQDVTYTAVYTNVTYPEALKTAYRTAPYESTFKTYTDANSMVALYMLMLQEYTTPQEHGILAERVVLSLEGLVKENSGLTFDCSTNWNYPITAMNIAMAKMTPTVWDRLSYSTRERLDTMMEGLAYVCSFGTSDYNKYYTGPGLGGNYHKSYNPNYRFGNLPMITFITYYFGNGNLTQGADRVNGMIKSFDQAKYDEMVAKFHSYGWKQAARVWTTEGIVAPDGTFSTDKASTLLIFGGSVMALSTDGKTIIARGNGAGVNNGGCDYVYTGYQQIPFTLYEAEEILRDVILYNYSGGTVKSEHYYDGKRVGWILDGTESPYVGMEGMMLEFASGNRSSTIYTAHDFLLAVPLLSGARALKRYDASGDLEKDARGNAIPLWDCTGDEALWKMIQVGNEDHIYKYSHGYQCYSTGSYGEMIKADYEKDASYGYFLCKYLWRFELMPLGSVPLADTFPN